MGRLSVEAIIAAVTWCVMCVPGLWYLLRRCYAYFTTNGIVLPSFLYYLGIDYPDMSSHSKR